MTSISWGAGPAHSIDPWLRFEMAILAALPYLWGIVTMFRAKVWCIAAIWMGMLLAFSLAYWPLRNEFDWRFLVMHVIALAGGAAYATSERRLSKWNREARL